MTNLTENVHFDSDLDMDTYRRILKHLGELFYRQLCIVKLFMNADQIDLDSLGDPNITPKLSSILTDCFEVRDKGYINSRNPLMERLMNCTLLLRLFSSERVNLLNILDLPTRWGLLISLVIT